jgi:antirestriction protein
MILGAKTMYSNFKIYVADIAAYNNGKCHGVWIDAMSDDINEQINDMLKLSPQSFAEEYAIHDYEGFGDVRLSGYQNIESVREIALFLYEYDQFGAGLLNYWDDNINKAKKAAEEKYQGCYESLADYAKATTEDISEIPSHLHYYIDFEHLGRDMQSNGEVYTIELSYQNVHVFSST